METHRLSRASRTACGHDGGVSFVLGKTTEGSHTKGLRNASRKSTQASVRDAQATIGENIAHGHRSQNLHR
jgi:hypothetical protein